jgi:hypothetical protein
VPKIHIIAEDKTSAAGKIMPLKDKNGNFAKCLYCEALGFCP